MQNLKGFFFLQCATALLFCEHLTAANLRKNDKQILQSSLTSDVHLQAFAAQRANVPRRSSFNVSEVKEYKAHSDADLLSDGTQTETGCVLRKEKQMIRCKGGNKYKTLSICRGTSLSSCHSSIRCYGSKRCEEIKVIFPGCKGIHTIGCKCAKCN